MPQQQGINILGQDDLGLGSGFVPAARPAVTAMTSTSAGEESAPAGLRAFGDVDATRKAIYDSVFDAASKMQPVTNKTHTLKLTGVQWVDPDRFTKRQSKEAALRGETLGRRMKGTWELSDAAGKVLDRREQVILTMPHLTDAGTFVHNGNEYSLGNQQRLRSGVFARVRDNGELESHVNVGEGGPSHKIQLDPAKGVFYTHVGNANIPVLSILQHLGAGEEEVRQAWGDDLYARNYSKADGSATPKLVEHFLRGKLPEGARPTDAIREAFGKMRLDPEVNRRTLGQPFDRVDKHMLLAATKKLLAVSRGEAEPDDRDHLAYQHFLGPEDLFRERLEKDKAGVRRQLLFKAGLKGHLRSMPSSALQQQVDAALIDSGVGQSLEEINPAEILDKNTKITRMGEGGIPSYDAIPDEARSVQPSHFGFMDPLRTPESFKAGVDVFLANNARKGADGKLYGRFVNARTGKPEWRTPQDLSDAVVAFPGAAALPYARIPVMKGGRMDYAKREEVDYVLPAMEHAFNPLNNMVPLKSMLKGQRASMASRMTTQALPLVNGEAPLVQNGVVGQGGRRSYEEEYGKHMGAVHADRGGRVLSAAPGRLTVRYDDGKVASFDLYDNHPYNRKTGITQTPTVEPGGRFAPGQLLAKSNFTDHTGAAALGLNARVAYTPWGGMNFEDATVISESMAKRMSSEHMYQHGLEVGDRHKLGKRAFLGLFPGKYDKATLANHDDDGLVKVGTRVKYGDPLILAAEERDDAQNKLHKRGTPSHVDASVTWKHHDEGVVTDVVQGRGGPVVLVKSVHPMQVGDKMSGRYGDKGVIAAIVPDHQMPQDKQGRPFEVLVNDLGVISRTNPAQWAEAKLGQIAEKTGRPVKVEDDAVAVPDRGEWVRQQMAAHGVPDQEDIHDPVRGTTIPNVYTGNRFFMKLHHTAESKGQGRAGGAYAADETPAKGGEHGSKRVSLLDANALLSHGATEFLRDASAIRGQRDDNYLLQYLEGNTPSKPKVPLVYEKFLNELKAAGINVVRDGSQLHLMALTDRDVDRLAGERNLQHGDTVKFHDGLEPIKGGLFDPELTGGHHGTRWAAIKLAEPMPNPVMEEPVRRVLGLTQKRFEAVLAGEEPLRENGTGTGPKAIADALKNMNVDREILIARNKVQYGTKGERDAAVRKLGYLKTAKRLGVHPGDWVMNRAPVLPPQFRPVSLMGNKGVPLVSDPNYLYKELHEANRNLADMKGHVGEDGVGPERLAVYHAFKAVTGLGEPVTQASQEKQVKGILRSVFGSSPKFGTVQRKLISSTVDNVGRGVVSPDPDLDMDSVGLPEDRAFDVYERFVVRKLRRSGMPAVRAMQEVRDRSPLARKVLTDEMEHRPVVINRAPVLHRFGIMGFRPRLVKGSTLRVSPLIVKGFNMDFDGDAVQYHVPVSEEARQEVLDRMMPSRQLLSPSDFQTPVHVPGQEYVGGLFKATKGRNDKRAVRTFASARHVREAWHAGEIGINDVVHILADVARHDRR